MCRTVLGLSLVLVLCLVADPTRPEGRREGVAPPAEPGPRGPAGTAPSRRLDGGEATAHGDPDGAPSGPSPFVIEARVVEALEGGPVVVEARGAYRGTEPIKVWRDWRRARCRHPQAWELFWEIRVRLGSYLRGIGHLRPGDEWSETFYLHHDYSTVPAGEAQAEVYWSVWEPKQTKKGLIARPSVPVTINVLPATEERLASLRERLERELDGPDRPQDQANHVGRTILHTRHRALVPLAFRLFRSESLENPSPSSMVPLIYHSLRDAEEGHTEFVRHLTGDNPRRYPVIFDHWRSNKVSLPDKFTDRLKTCGNPWIRAMTYVTFPKGCDREWTESLLGELRDAPGKDFFERVNRLIDDLDDDRFEVRQRATEELTRMAESAEPELRKRLREGLSAEARRRVQWALESREGPVPDPDSEHALRLFEWLGTAEAIRVLEALAAGAPSRWRTMEAKACLERIKSTTPNR